MKNPRCWFGYARYPAHQPFYLGTVIAENSEMARLELLALWRKISPHEPPEIMTVVPGQIVILEDREEGRR